ncbi:MAG: prepilin-type N-terminal cleavage/methylation domain-containing protein [Verrucomicrobiales bacterium]
MRRIPPHQLSPPADAPSGGAIAVGAPADQTPARRLGRRGGFTLLEVILGLAILSLLIGGIYALARGSMELSADVAVQQAEETRVHALVELCRRTFEMMPGNAKFEMYPHKDGGYNVYDVVFTDYPLAFSWPGVPAGSKQVIFSTEKDAAGALQIRLTYLNEEEAEERETSSRLSADVGTSLVLIDNIKLLEWRVWNPSEGESGKWMEEWEDTARRPTLVEMHLTFFGDEVPMRAVFWVPTVVSPEQIVGAMSPSGSGQPGEGDQPMVGPDGTSRSPAAAAAITARAQGSRMSQGCRPVPPAVAGAAAIPKAAVAAEVAAPSTSPPRSDHPAGAAAAPDDLPESPLPKIEKSAIIRVC